MPAHYDGLNGYKRKDRPTAPEGEEHHCRKPVHDALGKLIKGEWWTGIQGLKTDTDGAVRLKGAPDSYTLRAADTIRRFSL